MVKNFYQSRKEPIRFVIVGGIATILHYGIYVLLCPVFNVNVSYATGYIVSFIFNFFLSNYFTFDTRPSIKKGFYFGGCHLINFLLHLGLLNVYLWLGVNREMAPIFVFAVAIPVNFILVKKALSSPDNP